MESKSTEVQTPSKFNEDHMLRHAGRITVNMIGGRTEHSSHKKGVIKNTIICIFYK